MADTDPNRSPAFQFYPKDFLTHATQAGMSLAEAGAYIRLLCHCWRNGGIPDEPDRLARMIGATPREMKAVWPTVRRCFETHPSDPGMLVQPRLEEESQKQAEFRRRQSDAATKRWHPSGNAMASKRDMPDASQTDALLSPVSDLLSPDSSHTHARGGAGAGSFPSDHRGHALCGRVCVPAFLHQQFCAGLGTDTADETLRAFYRRVLDGITGPIAPDPVKFWRDRVAAQWPAPSVNRKPSEVRAGGDAYELFDLNWAKDCFTLHENECPNAKAHAERMKRERTA